jgi:hypothetical protein
MDSIVFKKEPANSTGSSLLIIALLLAVSLTFLLELNLLLVLAYGLFLWSLMRVVFFQDRPFMLRWLVVLVATVQWIIVPSLAIDDAGFFQRRSMWVPIDEYLNLAVPAVFVFTLGLFAHGNTAERIDQHVAFRGIAEYVGRYPELPILLTFIAVIASFGAHFLPGFLSFVSYLLLNLKYAAVILFLFSNQPGRYFWIAGILGFMVIEAASSSLFHDAILWSVLIGGAYSYHMKWSVPLKLSLGIVFLIMITVINSVKTDYRDEFWVPGKEASATVYFDMTLSKVDSLFAGELDFSKIKDSMIARLNQGRIISRIIYNVPSKQSFLDGETIKEGVVAALVPRLFMPDKAVAGGKKTFQKLTGWQLIGNTSMGASVLGEAYGNFGVTGAIIFMGFFGYGLCLALLIVRSLTEGNPLALALIPCVFIHVIKAETDFVTVANFLVKSTVLYLSLFLVLTKLLHYRVYWNKDSEL